MSIRPPKLSIWSEIPSQNNEQRTKVVISSLSFRTIHWNWYHTDAQSFFSPAIQTAMCLVMWHHLIIEQRMPSRYASVHSVSATPTQLLEIIGIDTTGQKTTAVTVSFAEKTTIHPILQYTLPVSKQRQSYLKVNVNWRDFNWIKTMNC